MMLLKIHRQLFMVVSVGLDLINLKTSSKTPRFRSVSRCSALSLMKRLPKTERVRYLTSSSELVRLVLRLVPTMLLSNMMSSRFGLLDMYCKANKQSFINVLSSMAMNYSILSRAIVAKEIGISFEFRRLEIVHAKVRRSCNFYLGIFISEFM